MRENECRSRERYTSLRSFQTGDAPHCLTIAVGMYAYRTSDLPHADAWSD
jgi:hypothetical protein